MGYPANYYMVSIYYPVIAAVGFLVKIMAIVILSRGKCGLSKCITRYLVGIATADLIRVVFTAIMQQCNKIYNDADFLFIHPICTLMLVLSIAITDCSVWLTVGFTFDRFVAICCQKATWTILHGKNGDCILKTVAVVSCARCVSFYFTVEPEVIINNVPRRCVFTSEYLPSPAWKDYELFDSILTPLLTISFNLLCNVLTVRHIVLANRVRRILRKNRANQTDPELKNRRKSMILLFAPSANVIILWFPFVVHSMNWQVQNYSDTDKCLNTPEFLLQQVGFMLKFLSICANTCIYTLTQRKFRRELKNGVKYLFTLRGRC